MPHWVHLSPETCRGIETLLHNRPEYPNAFTADAIQTLTHEMMHALGVDSEAEAECLGMQVSAVLAEELGVPKHYALRLAHLNLENYVDLPPEYIDKKAVPRERGLGPPPGREVAALARRLSCSCRTLRTGANADWYMVSCDIRVTIAALVGATYSDPCSIQQRRAGTSQGYRARLRFLVLDPRLPIGGE